MSWLSGGWLRQLLCGAVLSHFSCVHLSVTLWTVAQPAPLSMGNWDQTYVFYASCTGRQVLYHEHHLGSPTELLLNLNRPTICWWNTARSEMLSHEAQTIDIHAWALLTLSPVVEVWFPFWHKLHFSSSWSKICLKFSGMESTEKKRFKMLTGKKSRGLVLEGMPSKPWGECGETVWKVF